MKLFSKMIASGNSEPLTETETGQSIVIKSEESLTPEDETRRDRRRERNKLAATKCRNKKKERSYQLERDSKQLTTHNEILKKEIAKLEEEKRQLEDILRIHQPACAQKPSQFEAEFRVPAPPPPIASSGGYAARPPENGDGPPRKIPRLDPSDPRDLVAGLQDQLKQEVLTETELGDVPLKADPFDCAGPGGVETGYGDSTFPGAAFGTLGYLAGGAAQFSNEAFLGDSPLEMSVGMRFSMGLLCSATPDNYCLAL